MSTGLVIGSDVRCEHRERGVTLGRAAFAWLTTDNLEPSMSQTAESDLIKRVAQGDTEAFSEVYDRFAGPMYSLAMRILRDGASAEDAVQEAFVQIWEKASTYDLALGKPITWAVTLARNRAIGQLRSSVRRQKLSDAVASETGLTEPALSGGDDTLMGNEMARQVRTALTQVAQEQRQAIEMAYFGGLTQTEIAAALNVPLGTVKARIRRGMLLMRELLNVN